MMLNLPQDGNVLGLSGEHLLLACSNGCHLLSKAALRCSERHNALYSEMGMAILGSTEEEDGCDEAGMTGGALDMAGEAIGIPSGI